MRNDCEEQVKIMFQATIPSAMNNDDYKHYSHVVANLCSEMYVR